MKGNRIDITSCEMPLVLWKSAPRIVVQLSVVCSPDAANSIGARLLTMTAVEQARSRKQLPYIEQDGLRYY